MTAFRRAMTRDNGASLIEFALILPLLIILLLGIVEFGWVFGQYNDVKHGAREGARIAAVNQGNESFLVTYACDSMDLTSPAEVSFSDSTNGKIGETATVSVVATPDSLSGFGLIEVFLPSTLTSTIDFRLEQDSTAWTSIGLTGC